MGQTLMGGVSNEGNVQLLTPEQQQYLSSIMGGTNPEEFQKMFQTSFVEPAQQMLQRQIIPGLKEAYLGEEQGSSALNQALAQSATDLSTSLGSQLMNQWNMAQGRGLQAAGTRMFEPMIQEQQGILGPILSMLGSIGGGFLGGPLGASLLGGLGSQLGGGAKKATPPIR